MSVIRVADLAFCGNVCTACPRYIATAGGDTGRLEAVALLWRACGWRDNVAAVEEIACSGCGSARWCRYGVRECASLRRIEHCGCCPDYPCGKVAGAFAKGRADAARCREVCSEEDFALLEKAFFRKKENLEGTRMPGG